MHNLPGVNAVCRHLQQRNWSLNGEYVYKRCHDVNSIRFERIIREAKKRGLTHADRVVGNAESAAPLKGPGNP